MFICYDLAKFRSQNHNILLYNLWKRNILNSKGDSI